VKLTIAELHPYGRPLARREPWCAMRRTTGAGEKGERLDGLLDGTRPGRR